MDDLNSILVLLLALFKSQQLLLFGCQRALQLHSERLRGTVVGLESLASYVGIRLLESCATLLGKGIVSLIEPAVYRVVVYRLDRGRCIGGSGVTALRTPTTRYHSEQRCHTYDISQTAHSLPIALLLNSDLLYNALLGGKRKLLVAL